MIVPEWPEGENLVPLIEAIQRLIGVRQTRLMSVAFCERVSHLLPDDASRGRVALAGRYADGKARRAEIARAHIDALSAWNATSGASAVPKVWAARWALRAVWGSLHPTRRFYAAEVAADAAETARHGAQPENMPPGVPHALRNAARATECAAQLKLLRDILGRPESLPTGDLTRWLAWQSGQVNKLARAIYDDRTFDHLPVLADALEDAGCSDESILSHCRGPGPHARGCWVVDLLLGKSG